MFFCMHAANLTIEIGGVRDYYIQILETNSKTMQFTGFMRILFVNEVLPRLGAQDHENLQEIHLFAPMVKEFQTNYKTCTSNPHYSPDNLTVCLRNGHIGCVKYFFETHTCTAMPKPMTHSVSGNINLYECSHIGNCMCADNIYATRTVSEFLFANYQEELGLNRCKYILQWCDWPTIMFLLKNNRITPSKLLQAIALVENSRARLQYVIRLMHVLNHDNLYSIWALDDIIVTKKFDMLSAILKIAKARKYDLDLQITKYTGVSKMIIAASKHRDYESIHRVITIFNPAVKAMRFVIDDLYDETQYRNPDPTVNVIAASVRVVHAFAELYLPRELAEATFRHQSLFGVITKVTGIAFASAGEEFIVAARDLKFLDGDCVEKWLRSLVKPGY